MEDVLAIRLSAVVVVAGTMAVATGSATAQMPTEAQKQALRSDCRSDFIAHCKGVSPGGVKAFDCLAKNRSSLSEACQAAVKAVDPGSLNPGAHRQA